MTQSTRTQYKVDYQQFLQDVIYESPDGGETIRVKRHQWIKSPPAQFQLLDLLDMLYYSQHDQGLADLLNQSTIYFNLKYRGE